MRIFLATLGILCLISTPALAKHKHQHIQHSPQKKHKPHKIKPHKPHPCEVRECTIADYAAAIRKIESSNRYDIRTNAGKGRYALGAYQIMDFNLKKWSMEALGREVSEQEFLNSPYLQDVIFEYKFKQYVKKYGNPETAAKVWLAGEGGYKTNHADIFGTTPSKYALRFLDALRGILGIFRLG